VPFYRVPYLAADGVPVIDGRTFDRIDARDLPLPLAFQTDTQHSDTPTSDQVGQIVDLGKDERGVTWALLHVDPLDANGNPIHPQGARAAAMIEQGGQWISVDQAVPVDAEITPICLQEDDEGFCIRQTFRASRTIITGATLTPTGAYDEAVVDPTPLEANGLPARRDMPMGLVASAAVAPVPALLASAGFTLTAGAAVDMADWELKPEHFQRPALSSEANYINVDDDGRVWGWIAPAERCHQSYPGTCVLASDQSPDLSDFLRNFLSVGDQRVPVGFLTMDTGHAPTAPGTSTATVAAHYDDTRNIAAIVTAGIVPDGEHSAGSVWFSGSVSPRLDAWQRTVLAAGQASGDWRSDPGQANRTLRAALVVPVPGFLRQREPVLASAETSGATVGTVTILNGLLPYGQASALVAATAPGGCGCGGEGGSDPARSPLTAAQQAALARVADRELDAALEALDGDMALAELPSSL